MNLAEKQDMFLDKTFAKSEILGFCEDLFKNFKPPVAERNDLQTREDRDYQVSDIQFIRENRNVTLCSPTGTGKNLVIIFSMEAGQKYLVLVPRIVLMHQLKEEILRFKPELKDKINCIGDGVTDFDKAKLVTICVYNSVDVVEPFCEIFHKIYVDEAHHISKPEIYQMFDEDDSASEHDGESYIQTIAGFSRLNNNVYLSATIDPQKNFAFRKREIREMIDAGWLCDYNIVVPVFPEDPGNRSVCKYLITGYRNLIVYCDSQKEGKKVCEIMNEILPGSTQYLDCNTAAKKREKILRDFKAGKLPYLVNVRILTEGFDAPVTKAVCFLHMPSSRTAIIQTIGRALRLHPDKKCANIILPYSVAEDGKQIQQFLSVLAKNDSRIQRSCSQKRTGGYIDVVSCVQDEENEAEMADVEVKTEMVYKNMSLRIFSPEEKGKMLLKYVNDNKNIPPYSFETEEGVKLGIFWNGMLSHGSNPKILEDLKEKSEIIKAAHEAYLKKKEEDKDKETFSPEEKGEMLLKYVEENKKIPPHSFETEEGVKLGKFWYSMLSGGRNPKILEDLKENSEIIKAAHEAYLKKNNN